MCTWEPRNIATKAGIVASYDPGNVGANVSNPAGWAAGNGISALSNRVTLGSADLLQGTAANQPLLSRSDNQGNIVRQSDTFSTTWVLTKCNAFGATDTGAAGAGSFANTARTTDPVGGSTADFIQEDATAATQHFISIVCVGGTGTFVFGIYAKDAGRTQIRMRHTSSGGGVLTAYYDLSAVTISGAAGSGDTTYNSSSIVSVGNGWCDCRITGTTTTSFNQFYVALADAGSYTYNGDNTKGIYLWGASLAPSSWATNYVKTLTVPLYAGLGGRQVAYFDGAAYYLKTAAFTLNQPTEVYSLANPITWTLNDAMFDGNALNSGKLYQSATTPNIRYTAGTVGTELTPPPAGTWRVSTVVFDGANSRISTNSGAFAVSDAGAGNMGGFTLGAAGTVGTTFWHGLRGREILCNKTNQAAEGNYIRWGLLKQATLY